MRRTLSLKKTQNGPSKNQKSITQFFKNINGSTAQSTSSEVVVDLTEEVRSTSLKRKATSPAGGETKGLATDGNCSTNKNHTSDKEFKKHKTSHNKRPVLSLRRSPRKHNGVATMSNILDDDNSENTCTQNVDDSCKSSERSPLAPVDNHDSSLEFDVDVKKASPKRVKCVNNDDTKRKISPRCCKEKTPSPKKNVTPKKNDCAQSSLSKQSPIRQSPRLASYSRSPQKSPQLNTYENEINRAKVALDFSSVDVDEMFKEMENDLNIGNIDEIEAEDLDLSVIQRCEIIHIEKNTSSLELKVRNDSKGCATCILEGIWQDTPLSVGETLSIMATRGVDNIYTVNNNGGLLVLRPDHLMLCTSPPPNLKQDTPLSVGETLSIMATRGVDNRYTVNNNGGLLVLRPDHLMSCTSVVAGVFCRRKAVLQERFRGIDSANDAMTIGILIHELVQKALAENISDPVALKKVAEVLLKDSIHMLYDAGISIQQALTSMTAYIPSLVQFMNLYVLKAGSTVMNNQKDRWNGHINEILDIEENVCCPQLGVKGKIDATVQVTIYEKKGKRTSVVPLELKSGRASGSAEHRGQLVLYGMMMALQRGEDPAHGADQKGLLLYLKDKVDLREVSCGYPERRDLVMLRNQLVQHLASSPDQADPDAILDIEDAAHVFRQQLPEPVHHQTACAKCPYLTLCSLYLWNTEGPEVTDRHPLRKLQEEATGHLSPSHIQYFLHWAAMLRLEEKGQTKAAPLHALWTEAPDKRARRGVCICNVTLTSVEPKEGRFQHTFHYGTIENADVSKRGLQEGEFVVVSIDQRPWIAAGVITSLSATQLQILLERDISGRHTKSQLYHIDSYESTSGTVQNLTNLGALMDNNDQANKLRRLLIDKVEPEFELKLNREVGRLGAKLMKSLNREQQRAVLKAITAKDYMLLQGLPGTGKTQTLSVLIQMLVSLKQSVLVTAHTHSAVDTVLSRLPASVRMLRLGSATRVTPSLVSRCEHTVAASCTSPEELERLYDSMEVVGVTCLGATHALVSRRTFDVCVVDEATQALQSTALRPLLAARRFVLVGDPDQLPPVVRSRPARKLGMEQSLFTRLKDTGGTETLKLQYRMNATLTKLANDVAYNGNLRCATDRVRDATINVQTECLQEMYEANYGWLVQACSADMEKAALFLDTGSTKSFADSKSCANKEEVYIVLALIDAHITSGVETSSIGVIAPYRDQVGLLRNSVCRLRKQSSLPEVSTVDQFQGKDKSVIIYSCTRSEGDEDRKVKEGEVLNDQRRLTVAITRAKHKLIVIGDAVTLRRYPPFGRLLAACVHITLHSEDHNQLYKDYSRFAVDDHS